MAVVLHGPGYSTYTRTARLALIEKGVAHRQADVDVFGGQGRTPEHLARQPWGKVPAFEHDGFSLFETFAIARYIDEAFPGPSLQPAEPRARARMTQICGIIDSYAYGAMVGQVVWQQLVVPMQGGTPDAAVTVAGMQESERALDVIEGLATGGLLCGDAVTLADLHLVPVIDYFRMVEAGGAALAARPKLAAWWARMEQRPSVAETRPQLG